MTLVKKYGLKHDVSSRYGGLFHLPVLEYLRVGVVLALEHVDVARLVRDGRVVQEGLQGARRLRDAAPVASHGSHLQSGFADSCHS